MKYSVEYSVSQSEDFTFCACFRLPLEQFINKEAGEAFIPAAASIDRGIFF